MILTLDFGTTATKVGLWRNEGLVALARSELRTVHRHPGWAEQDPSSWWTALVIACAEVRAKAPEAFREVEVVGATGARQSFALATGSGETLGPAVLWSDCRAGSEVEPVARRAGGLTRVRVKTGVPLDASSVAAKLMWLEENEPSRISASDWLLSPRDLMVWRLTGEVATDATMATRSGLYDESGEPVEELVGRELELLAPLFPSDEVVGRLRAVPAAELGLRPGTPVAIGAGDRACEVLGSGATPDAPMISWGTTANISMPAARRRDLLDTGAVLSRGALQGWLVEAGVSSAGSFMNWLERISNSSVSSLVEMAKLSPPGARGVVAVPWLDGARSPWWRGDARAGFVGLSSAHGLGDLARAAIESIALDIAACLEVMGGSTDGGPPVRTMNLCGAGSANSLWRDVLSAVTQLPAVTRASGEAASAGAAMLASRSVGMNLSIDELNPIKSETVPEDQSIDSYKGICERSRLISQTLLNLSF